MKIMGTFLRESLSLQDTVPQRCDKNLRHGSVKLQRKPRILLHSGTTAGDSITNLPPTRRRFFFGSNDHTVWIWWIWFCGNQLKSGWRKMDENMMIYWDVIYIYICIYIYIYVYTLVGRIQWCVCPTTWFWFSENAGKPPKFYGLKINVRERILFEVEFKCWDKIVDLRSMI